MSHHIAKGEKQKLITEIAAHNDCVIVGRNADVILEEQKEASLFFLLKDSESRAELVARFMGILELIKLRRVLITTITVTDDVVEYNEKGLEMKFRLNPDYIPPETNESEFDALPESSNETEKEEDK